MIVSKENLKINPIKESNETSTYSVEPLPTGFGHTLGNALRRVLLTEIEGAAVTQIKIAGASHQFTTLPGVKEDVVQLTLNVKKLRFKIHTDNPVVATLKKKGAGPITAKDLEIPSDLEIMNKDLHLATLADSKSELNIELIVEPGVGYSPMEERQTSKVGVIVLDSLFSPVLNVTYAVEPTRFGDKTDLDKLLITVETDGSVSPKQALVKASGILKGYYESFEKWELETDKSIEPEEENAALIDVEDVAVDELPLQTRTINALKKHGIDTLKQLAKKSDDEIADIKNLGEKSLEEIKKLLKKEGLR
ncbi:DNA-directed RNA polymerase subunit alpha [candidate division WWE3 bacterium RIFOXYC2_FULL_42_13]|uniref:DNA-directed RNA polymerase subunit alpha n=2 Tax=Katanobacteria TaxID=422282 RepID=A0A0G1EQ08_UNCKA|nr:MAG: DNA-directed RNA polymerase subunit alpha [candidate division WWE3 bacterium GW2011_GWB2_43_22]OGC58492.1 MAG: DNA-directed RNA polymerase subunit alpha [candidate division WWE3 bacterium RIFOXYA2_FULL_43_12]OGC66881.1 MAG: DNA-directed RNA polymerase subunit alpha [candidate division WWE3 bacterium RIFOXYA12_FULL_43_11]OGC71994.1 MAG: DNA-directed RNA polymerase subunit alpha [candidate division WWE3 bacterium RIFOXYB2_FULL_43_9]OGC73399.1 MAG: DNA-directed RNA polymerase subunit alpha